MLYMLSYIQSLRASEAPFYLAFIMAIVRIPVNSVARLSIERMFSGAMRRPVGPAAHQPSMLTFNPPSIEMQKDTAYPQTQMMCWDLP